MGVGRLPAREDEREERMAEFTLPANSKVKEGKAWPSPEGARNRKSFHIYRWNPDDGQNPQVDTYAVDLDDCGQIGRASCRERVCQVRVDLGGRRIIKKKKMIEYYDSTLHNE